jgi:hypothetical protein
MLIVRKSLVEAVEAVRVREDLYPILQQAVELELATIPVYLTGLFTAPQGSDVAKLVMQVAREEMTHMCVAANLLIALGGKPDLTTADIARPYPKQLPGGADDGLVVLLRAISMDVVLNTYMRIEEPDAFLQPTGAPIPLSTPSQPLPGQYASIGDFYRALLDKLGDLPAGSFDASSTNRQVSRVFRQSTVVTDLETARTRIRFIISQGEGDAKSPLVAGQDPPHFYRFAQIVMKKKIVVTGATYAFSGDSVALDESKVPLMFPDPTLAEMKRLLAADEFAKCLAFSQAYTKVLDKLHETFNTDVGAIGDAEDAMTDLPNLAAAVLAISIGSTGQTAGLCFEVVR